MDIAQVIYGEDDYASAHSCYSCLWNAIKRSGHSLSAIKRGENVYIARRGPDEKKTVSREDHKGLTKEEWEDWSTRPHQERRRNSTI